MVAIFILSLEFFREKFLNSWELFTEYGHISCMNPRQKQIIEDIIRLHNQNSKLTRDIYDKSSPTYSRFIINKEFGSWNKALKAAGIKINKIHVWTKKQLLEKIILFYKETQSSSIEKFIEHSGIYDRTIKRNFGSWHNALNEANIPIHQRALDKEILIKDLKDVSIKLNKNNLTFKEYSSNGKFHSTTISKVFNGWNKALLEAGLSVKKIYSYTKEELLQKLQEFYKKYNKVPTCETYINHDRLELPCSAAYISTFENLRWKEILELAGLPIDYLHRGFDNIIYDSDFEVRVANILYNNNIKYIPHRKICDDRYWRCDFYILPQNKKPELWIECDGLGSRREAFFNAANRFQEKLQYYKNNNLNLLIIKKRDNIFNKLNNYLNF